VAKSDGDIPNFEHLNIPDGELAPAEPVAEERVAAPEVVEIVEAQPALAAPAEEIKEIGPPGDNDAHKEENEEEEEAEEKKPSKLPVILPAVAAIGLPVIAVGLAAVDILYFSTAIYIVLLGYIPLALWLSRKTNTVFVVILGCVVAAVLTACYCLWMELGRYKYDVKAQEAKQRVTMVEPRGQHDRIPPAALV
jgi:hypothetical protein